MPSRSSITCERQDICISCVTCQEDGSNLVCRLRQTSTPTGAARIDVTTVHKSVTTIDKSLTITHVFLLNYAVSLDEDGDGTHSTAIPGPTAIPRSCSLAYYLLTGGDGGRAKKNGGKPGLYNSLVQKIDVGVRNDQMHKVTALKFKW